jgi:hypothetical protein
VISPDLIAYADQRIASAAEFLDSMIGSLREVDACVTGADSALEALALSDLLLACYRRNGSHPETTCDALALALRRLAAK